MIFASLCGHSLVNNVIFDRNSSANRDDCFAPYVLLREKFSEVGVQLNTADINSEETVVFELHQDVQDGAAVKKKYLLMFETDLVKPENGSKLEHSKYDKVFTWNDGLIDDRQYIKINFPNPLRIPNVEGFYGRDKFCCLIAGNKTVRVADSRELYSERVKSIRWFEKNAPDKFDLYGADWHLPPPRPGLKGKLSLRFWRYMAPVFNMNPFPSYRGKVDHKADVLSRTRFAICYENVRDLPGYITEKIFDCFFYGCVPVYWGANNIDQYIPKGCFVDRREFQSTAEVFEFIDGMSEEQYLSYQQCIADFLASDAAYPFSSEFFAETIINTVVQDLELQS